MTYDVTRTTFSTSFALHNHANFGEYFEKAPSIEHPDFCKLLPHNSSGDPQLFIFIQHGRLREADSCKCLLL